MRNIDVIADTCMKKVVIVVPKRKIGHHPSGRNLVIMSE